MADVFLKGVTDLFGAPVPRSRGKKGRPAHVPTVENRHFVTLALVAGVKDREIAAGLGITIPTLRQHYFYELGDRRAARLKLKMLNLGAMVAQVKAGKPAAMAQLAKQIEKFDRADQASALALPSPRPKKEPGKKEAARIAAAEAEGLYAPRSGPSLTH